MLDTDVRPLLKHIPIRINQTLTSLWLVREISNIAKETCLRSQTKRYTYIYIYIHTHTYIYVMCRYIRADCY